MTRTCSKALATVALAGTFAAPALVGAQTLNVQSPSSFTLSSARRTTGNHDLLLASAIILLVGLADDNQALTILGGVGVLICVADNGQLGYRAYRHDLLKSGPLSFGFATFGNAGPNPSFTRPYAQLSFRF